MNKRIEESGLIFVNEEVGPQLYLVEIGAPNIASLVKPGQFIHVGIPDMEAHVLRRPFSVYSAIPEIGLIQVLYQEVGFGTRHLSNLTTHDRLELIGPLGTGWSPPDVLRRALVVAGGVGAAPLYMLLDQMLKRGVSVDVVMGARTRSALVCRERYEELISDRGFSLEVLRFATDDGSFGHTGFTTDVAEKLLEENSYDYVAACGPEPMMKHIAEISISVGTLCEISLEKRMACGIGACLSCVVQTVDGLKRSCFDGPVMDAKKVIFDER